MKVMVADGSPLIGEGIAMIVKSIFTDADLTIASSAIDLVKELHGNDHGNRYHIILIDQETINNIEFSLISQLSSKTKVCLMTSLRPGEVRYPSSEITFDSVISKFSTPDDLKRTINTLMIDHNTHRHATFKTITKPSPIRKADLSQVTKREQEVLNLMAKGYSNKEIARLCDITEATVKRHLSNIFKKLNVPNRVKATHVAIQKKLIS